MSAVVFSQQARKLLHGGVVSGIAGVLRVGDALSTVVRCFRAGVEQAETLAVQRMQKNGAN